MNVVVSQRVDVWEDRGERRDALDQRLSQWLWDAGCVPIPVPNFLASLAGGHGACSLQAWLLKVNPDGVLLSGGNDIGTMPERDRTEVHLLTYAQDQRLPVLGICRGMQMMAIGSGGSLVPVTGHVRSRHRLRVAKGCSIWPDEVNSFHNLALSACPSEYGVTAWSEDNVIESIRHKTLPWEGWMWHPEREGCFSAHDTMRFRALLDGRKNR